MFHWNFTRFPRFSLFKWNANQEKTYTRLRLTNDFWPHFPFGGKSSIVKVFGQQTNGLEASPPHCDCLKKIRCWVDIELVRRRYNGRHCCKVIQFPFQPSGVLHGLSARNIDDYNQKRALNEKNKWNSNILRNSWFIKSEKTHLKIGNLRNSIQFQWKSKLKYCNTL